MRPRTAPGPTDYLLLLFLGLIFGSSFMFTNISVQELPPLTVAASRVFIAAVIFVFLMWRMNQHIAIDPRLWIWVLASGLLGNAIPFSLISWGQVKVDASLTAIFMAVIPLATMSMAHFLTQDEKMGVSKAFGVLLGLLGVILLMGWESVSRLGENIVQQFAIVLATLCYAANAIITKKLVKQPKIAISAWLMVSASSVLVPLCLVIEKPWKYEVSGKSILAIMALGIGPTAFATWMIILIIGRQGASFLSQINFIVPISGVVLANVFLGEVLPASGFVALLIILLGIALSRGNWAFLKR